MTEKTDKKAPIFVRFVGSKNQFFIGAPQKDLTKAEFDKLDTLVQRDILAETLYKKAVEPAKETK